MVSIDPAVPDLAKSDFSISCNNHGIDYNIQDISNGLGTMYNITPRLQFSRYDTVSVQLINSDYVSDIITIFMSKYTKNNKSTFDFTLPDNVSGKCELNIAALNDAPFNVIPQPIIISPPLDASNCAATLEGSGTYNTGEPVYVNIELNTQYGNHIPDGIYFAEITDRS